jgi:hypothetical protein
LIVIRADPTFFPSGITSNASRWNKTCGPGLVSRRETHLRSWAEFVVAL